MTIGLPVVGCSGRVGTVWAGLTTRWPDWRVPLGGTKSPHLARQMYPTLSNYGAAPLRSTWPH